MKQPILSICIPTYNRFEMLDKTLASIFDSDVSLEEFEVVISDNNSTDDTELVVFKYQKKYNNVRYFKKNQLEIADKNIIDSLKLGEGLFLKLCNDTACFRKGALKILINYITNNKINKKILFFSNTSNRITHNITNFDSFIKSASYLSTSILTVGFWKKDLQKIDNIESAFRYMLPGINLYILYFNLKTQCLYIADELFEMQYVKNKGGYNIIDVFVTNYLGIILRNEYKNNKISKITYEIEKIKVLKGFVAPWMKLLKKKESGFTFSIEGANKKLFKIYYYNPLFYLMVLYFFIFDLIQKLRN